MCQYIDRALWTLSNALFVFVNLQLIVPELRGLLMTEYTRTIVLIHDVFLYSTKLRLQVLFLDLFNLQSLLIYDIVQIFQSLLCFLLLRRSFYLIIIALHKRTTFLVFQGVGTSLDRFRNVCTSSYQITRLIWRLLSKRLGLLLINIWKFICARLVIFVSTSLALSTIISILIWILHSFGYFP